MKARQIKKIRIILHLTVALISFSVGVWGSLDDLELIRDSLHELVEGLLCHQRGLRDEVEHLLRVDELLFLSGQLQREIVQSHHREQNDEHQSYDQDLVFLIVVDVLKLEVKFVSDIIQALCNFHWHIVFLERI